jgi:hypothetical protein
MTKGRPKSMPKKMVVGKGATRQKGGKVGQNKKA